MRKMNLKIITKRISMCRKRNKSEKHHGNVMYKRNLPLSFGKEAHIGRAHYAMSHLIQQKGGF